MLGLIDRATVYSEGAGGAFDTVAKSNLACRLAHVMRAPAATAPERAELAALRNLLWDPGYALPSEHVQIDVGGTRYNVVVGTVRAMRGPMGTVAYRAADVVRAA